MQRTAVPPHKSKFYCGLGSVRDGQDGKHSEKGIGTNRRDFSGASGLSAMCQLLCPPLPHIRQHQGLSDVL